MTKTQKKGKYQNKSVYLNAALVIVDEQGVEKLTMRRLAEHMDISPMAIYKHFPNKEALLRETLDEFILRANVIPNKELPLDQWITHVAHAMFSALSGETSWLPTLGSVNVGPNALAVTAAFMQRMMQEGLDFSDALRAYLAIVHLVIGAVTIQSALCNNQNTMSEDLKPLANDKKSELQLDHLMNTSQIDIGLPLIIESLQRKSN